MSSRQLEENRQQLASFLEKVRARGTVDKIKHEPTWILGDGENIVPLVQQALQVLRVPDPAQTTRSQGEFETPPRAAGEGLAPQHAGRLYSRVSSLLRPREGSPARVELALFRPPRPAHRPRGSED